MLTESVAGLVLSVIACVVCLYAMVYSRASYLRFIPLTFSLLLCFGFATKLTPLHWTQPEVKVLGFPVGMDDDPPNEQYFLRFSDDDLRAFLETEIVQTQAHGLNWGDGGDGEYVEVRHFSVTRVVLGDTPVFCIYVGGYPERQQCYNTPTEPIVRLGNEIKRYLHKN